MFVLSSIKELYRSVQSVSGLPADQIGGLKASCENAASHNANARDATPLPSVAKLFTWLLASPLQILLERRKPIRCVTEVRRAEGRCKDGDPHLTVVGSKWQQKRGPTKISLEQDQLSPKTVYLE